MVSESVQLEIKLSNSHIWVTSIMIITIVISSYSKFFNKILNCADFELSEDF